MIFFSSAYLEIYSPRLHQTTCSTEPQAGHSSDNLFHKSSLSDHKQLNKPCYGQLKKLF